MITNHSENNNKRQQVAVELMTVAEQQLEERLHNVQRSMPADMNHEDVEFDRWYADAVGIIDELHCFLLQRRDDSAGDIQWFQRSEEDPAVMSQWKDQLELYEFCFSLKRNDPHIREVELSFDRFLFMPDGCLRYVGNAMLKNTNITELKVDVSIMFDEDNDIQRAAALIEFVQTSTTLRKIRILSNDYSTTEHTDVCNRLAGLILDAMTANTSSVQELVIESIYPIDAFHRLLSTSTSLKALRIDCYDFNMIENNDHRNQLLRALAKNRSIDQLKFTVSDNGWEWLEAISQSMGSGPAKIRELNVAECSRLPPLFYNLMQTTTLHTLEMERFWQAFSWENQTMLCRALAHNKSIENLKLIVGTDKHWDVIDNILLHLHNGPSTLRKLSVKHYNGDFNALRQYLCRTTAKLQTLELEECVINEDGMTCLMEGLQEHDSRQPAVAIQVALKSCGLREKAMNGLVELLAKRSKCHNWHHRQVWGSLLLSEDPNLDMKMPSPPETRDTLSTYVPDGMVVSMSTTLVPSMSSGVSSDHPGSTQFVSLSMLPKRNIPACWDPLMANTEVPSLVCLQLSDLGPADSLKLARCLPCMTSLSALHLVKIRDNVLPANILKGLRRNGSVLTTSFLMEGRVPFFQHKRDRIVVQAYCQRNRFLAELIGQKKLTFRNVFSMDVAMLSNDSANRHGSKDNSCCTDQLVLLPKLFRVANAIPLIRSQFMLVALLELNATISHHKEED